MPNEPSRMNADRLRDVGGARIPEPGPPGALDFGTPRSASEGKVLLGIFGGFFLGLFTGWMAPPKWFSDVKIPPTKGGVMESILGGVGMTFTQQAQSTVTTTTKSGSPTTIKEFYVYFDTNDSLLESSQQTLVLGDSSSGTTSKAEIKPQRFAYIGVMTYEISSSSVVRTFSIVDQDSTFTKTFTGGVTSNSPEEPFSCDEVPTANGKSQLEFRYMGYLDIVEMDLVASS